MGCVSSVQKTNDDDEAKRAEMDVDPEAKRQRRRLSVAPQHVGDITKEFKVDEDEDEDEGLTELEVRCKAHMVLQCAAKSKKGIVPYNRNKVNQDRTMVKWALGDDENAALFGVMDGHGEFGHLVAEFVKEKLPETLGTEKCLREDPEKAILSAVKRMCDSLAQSQINIAFSGTTCVFGVLLDRRLYVGNIGDSRCVLCRQGPDGSLIPIPLSIDQKPDSPAEKARILKAGGRVEPLPGPPGEDCGPPRVWLAEVDVPGLAMSRSVGDEVSQTVGVISTPEIMVHDIEENDIFVIWATDGVWEFISSQEALQLIWQYRDNLKLAADKLIEESTKRWKQEEEVVDDISCVIVSFNKSKDIPVPPPSTTADAATTTAAPTTTVTTSTGSPSSS